MIAVAEHVGHAQDLDVDLVVDRDVVRVAALEPRDGLGQGQVEVLAHHCPHLGGRPVLRVRCSEEIGDLVGVGVPRRGCRLDGVRVTGLRRGDELGGQRDVLAQQAREFLAGGDRRRTA